MRTILLTLALMLAAFTSSAEEERTFHEGQTLTIGGTILCDTEEQSRQLAVSYMDGWQEGQFALRLAMAIQNELGEPICASMRAIRVTLVRTVDLIGVHQFPNGTDSPLYVTGVLWTDRSSNQRTGFIFTDFPLRPPVPQGSSL